MKKVLRIITIILAVIGAFYLLLLMFLSTNGFSDKSCTSETVKIIKSQNNKYSASLTYQRCPPESHISAVVIVRSENMKTAKSVFSALSHMPGSLAENIDINYEINLNWSDPNTLLIEYPERTIVTSKEHAYNEVNIIYNEKNR